MRETLCAPYKPMPGTTSNRPQSSSRGADSPVWLEEGVPGGGRGMAMGKPGRWWHIAMLS